MRLNSNKEMRVVYKSCLSERRCFIKGFTIFSENKAAGANMEELVVLIIADSKEPKKMI